MGRQNHGGQGTKCSLSQGPVRHPRRRPIKRPDVLLYLKKVEQAGTLEKRDRARSAGEQICVYADVDGTDYNPFRNLTKQLLANVSEPRPALTDSPEVARLFQTIAAPFDRARFRDLVGYAVRFTSLTVVRPGEIATAEWSEFDFTTARWTIPAEENENEARACRATVAAGGRPPPAG